jgi:hypothetical protein
VTRRPFNVECDEIKFKSLADRRKKESFLFVKDQKLSKRLEQLATEHPIKSTQVRIEYSSKEFRPMTTITHRMMSKLVPIRRLSKLIWYRHSRSL